jgi:hypothetical protein
MLTLTRMTKTFVASLPNDSPQLTNVDRTQFLFLPYACPLKYRRNNGSAAEQRTVMLKS